MLVDPNTGMPIEMDTPESLLGGALGAQSASAGALSAVGQQAGFFGPGSIPDAALDAVPGLSQTTAWNTFRGSRTIAYGGKGVSQISGFAATMNPKYMFRMPSAGALGGRSVETANYAFASKKYAPGATYTPFNILARGGNYGFEKTAGYLGKKESLGKIGSAITSINSEGKAFNVGALSRITAGSKMARGKLPTGNLLDFMGKTDQSLYQNYTKNRALMGLRGTTLSGKEASHLLAMSNTGAVSGRIAGFMATTQTGALATTGADAALNYAGQQAGATSYKAGSKAAIEFMSKGGFERAGGQFAVKAGSEKMFAKAGLKAGDKVTMSAAKKIGGKAGLKIGARLGAAAAVNAIPIAGQIASAVLLADLAMDVGKLGVEVFKSGVDFAKDAAISYKGSINKGVMGMGYRDNTVAATSRSRGVQAIQNSRLNARSVLGSEAGAMHAHFG